LVKSTRCSTTTGCGEIFDAASASWLAKTLSVEPGSSMTRSTMGRSGKPSASGSIISCAAAGPIAVAVIAAIAAPLRKQRRVT
jgi:hypothetical protein